jgi:hypothetical protein
MKHVLTALLFAVSMVASAQTDKPGTRDIINSFLTELLEFSKDAGAFAKEQVPLVLQEYVKWGIAEGLMIFFGCSLYIIGFAYGAKRWAIDAHRGDDDLAAFLYLMIGGILSLMAFVGALVDGILPAIKAIVAPRVYLIEKLSDLIK